MKTFKEFIEEATKEMTLKQVMKKINDGYWEAEQDIKVGRHAILRDIKTKKRITVYIKEDLNEATKTIDIPADVYRASLGHDPKKWKKWYTANGFSVDSKTNRLSKDNNLWKIDTSTKSLVVMNESEDLDEDEKTNTEGSMKTFSEYLEEAETAGRAWHGKLKRIDKLMAWMYDKEILTKGEMAAKDKVFRQYYRYYNDGDFPRGLKVKGVSAYDDKKTIAKALEEYLDDFIKKMLKKYMPKIDRVEFRYDKVISDLKDIKDSLDRKDMYSFFNYYSKKTTIQDDEHGTYSKLYRSLNSEYNDLVSATNSIDKASSNYTMAYRRDLLKKAGTWNKDLEKKWIAIEDLCNKLSNFIGNVISSINKMKTLRQLDKE